MTILDLVPVRRHGTFAFRTVAKQAHLKLVPLGRLRETTRSAEGTFPHSSINVTGSLRVGVRRNMARMRASSCILTLTRFRLALVQLDNASAAF